MDLRNMIQKDERKCEKVEQTTEEISINLIFFAIFFLFFKQEKNH